MDLQPFADLINSLLRDALLPTLAAILFGALMDLYMHGRSYLKARLGNEKEAFIEKTIRRLVLAAEAYFAGPGRGSEKMNWVMKQGQAYLARKGYNVDLELLVQWAEAIVKSDLHNYPELESFAADGLLPLAPAPGVNTTSTPPTMLLGVVPQAASTAA